VDKRTVIYILTGKCLNITPANWGYWTWFWPPYVIKFTQRKNKGS